MTERMKRVDDRLERSWIQELKAFGRQSRWWKQVQLGAISQGAKKCKSKALKETRAGKCMAKRNIISAVIHIEQRLSTRVILCR